MFMTLCSGIYTQAKTAVAGLRCSILHPANKREVDIIISITVFIIFITELTVCKYN